MKKLIRLVIVLIIPIGLNGQVELENIYPKTFKNQSNLLQQIHHRIQIEKTASTEQNDLIVGYTDPNEVVTIEGDYFLDGNITIVNNGILKLNQANFRINGDIFIMGNGELQVHGGTFTVNQEYIYEHDAVIVQGGTLTLTDVDFHSNTQSWSIALTDSAEYILKNSRISDGFITAALMGKSRSIIRDSELPGEFLCMGENYLEFQGCDQILVWIVLPDTAVVDISLPDDSLLVNFQFSEDNSNITNVPYSITIDSCTNVLWGLISESGSDATFYNTDFRTVGLYFMRSDSIAVTNITNESFHSDDIIHVSDRNLHLINCNVHTWSFYTAKNSNISINNCIFGELIAMDSSRAFVNNSVCDGSGGYLGAFQYSSILVVGSLIRSQVISREFGTLLGVYSAFTGSEIDSDESSVMLIANTAIFTEPEAHDSALIFEFQVYPFEGEINTELPVTGTMRIIAGPLNPIKFHGYQIKYRHEEELEWLDMGEFHAQPVVQDTLTVWYTTGLAPGGYDLLAELHHSFGDSIAIGSYARLEEKEEVISCVFSTQSNPVLKQNFPNPFNATTVIPITLFKPSHVKLIVYDICGRKISELINEELGVGDHHIKFNANDLSGGLYFYRFITNSFSETKKFLFIE